MFSSEWDNQTKWGIILFKRTDYNQRFKKMKLFQYRSIETPTLILTHLPQWKYEIWKQTTKQIISPLLTLSWQCEKSNHLNHTKKNVYWKKIIRKNGIDPHTPVTKFWHYQEKIAPIPKLLHPCFHPHTPAQTKLYCPKTDNETNNHSPCPCFNSNVNK